MERPIFRILLKHTNTKPIDRVLIYNVLPHIFYLPFVCCVLVYDNQINYNR